MIYLVPASEARYAKSISMPVPDFEGKSLDMGRIYLPTWKEGYIMGAVRRCRYVLEYEMHSRRAVSGPE